MIRNWDEEAKARVKRMTGKEKDRLEAIMAMHTMVINMNDESAYMSWIYLVPDEASEWDFIDFAVNDEEGVNGNHLFDDAVKLFKSLWNRYAKEEGGLYIGGKCY